ncbi:MAG: hypothetical protein ACE5J9_09690 [Methanosarcinales archaeon]
MKNILEYKTDFINLVLNTKEKIILDFKQQLSKKEHKEHLSSSEWEWFIKKSSLSFLSKFLLARIAEDNGVVKEKLTDKGLKIWKKFSKNIPIDKLVEIAFRDLERSGKTYTKLYKYTVYDDFRPNVDLVTKMILEFKEYNFANIDAKTIQEIYSALYPEEERKELQEFYVQSPILDYMLKQGDI